MLVSITYVWHFSVCAYFLFCVLWALFVCAVSVHSLSTLFWLRLIRLSSATVAYPLRGLTRCVFRDALLHTTVLMCGYLHYCCLSAFLPENPRRSAVTEILKPPRLAPIIIQWSKLLRSHFFPILTFGLNNSWASWPSLHAFIAFSCCHVIGWLNISINKLVSSLIKRNKVLTECMYVISVIASILFYILCLCVLWACVHIVCVCTESTHCMCVCLVSSLCMCVVCPLSVVYVACRDVPIPIFHFRYHSFGYLPIPISIRYFVLLLNK